MAAKFVTKANIATIVTRPRYNFLKCEEYILLQKRFEKGSSSTKKSKSDSSSGYTLDLAHNGDKGKYFFIYLYKDLS